MKNIFIIIFCSITLSIAQKKASEFQNLLNYKDFLDFNTFVLVPNVKAQRELEMVDSANHYLLPKAYLSENPSISVFKFQQVDNKYMLVVSGELLGFLSTKKEYENYHLKMRFKWGKKWSWLGARPRDSGIFYHSIPDANNKHEMNIHDGDIGSFWSFGTVSQIPCIWTSKLPQSISIIKPIIKHIIPSLRDTMPVFNANGKIESIGLDTNTRQICLANPIADKPLGEWNEIELICYGDTSIHIVNGVTVVKLFNSRYKKEGKYFPLTKGRITLQSEGGEMFIEYIKIKSISKIPSKFLN
jgi:hypothetical protein